MTALLGPYEFNDAENTDGIVQLDNKIESTIKCCGSSFIKIRDFLGIIISVLFTALKS